METILIQENQRYEKLNKLVSGTHFYYGGYYYVLVIKIKSEMYCYNFNTSKEIVFFDCIIVSPVNIVEEKSSICFQMDKL